MELEPFLFWAVAALTGTSAIAVVVTQNIVRSATWLLFALAGTAGIFFLLGADFVGATQLLVYVGGTLVLVVFGVMLTAQGPFVTMSTGAAEWAVALVVGLLLYGALAMSILSGRAAPNAETQRHVVQGSPESKEPSKTVTLGKAFLGMEDAIQSATVAGTRDRERKKMGYLLPFEIVSVHLLVVLIGAAYLARAKRRRGIAS